MEIRETFENEKGVDASNPPEMVHGRNVGRAERPNMKAAEMYELGKGGGWKDCGVMLNRPASRLGAFGIMSSRAAFAASRARGLASTKPNKRQDRDSCPTIPMDNQIEGLIISTHPYLIDAHYRWDSKTGCDISYWPRSWVKCAPNSCRQCNDDCLGCD